MSDYTLKIIIKGIIEETISEMGTLTKFKKNNNT
jgi:hypothetical protein